MTTEDSLIDLVIANGSFVSVSMKTADITAAMQEMRDGDAIRLFSIPAGATILTSGEELVRQLLEEDTVTVEYTKRWH